MAAVIIFISLQKNVSLYRLQLWLWTREFIGLTIFFFMKSYYVAFSSFHPGLRVYNLSLYKDTSSSSTQRAHCTVWYLKGVSAEVRHSRHVRTNGATSSSGALYPSCHFNDQVSTPLLCEDEQTAKFCIIIVQSRMNLLY